MNAHAAWTQRPTETAPAFQAFALYRDAGPGRSLRGVARELAKSGSLISRWSSRHDWKDRVAAWDTAQDRHRRLAITSGAVAASAQHVELLRTHLAAVSLPALELARRFEADPTRLTKLDDRSLIELVCKAARPVAKLVDLEREVLGVDSGTGEPCCAQEAARRRIEHLSDEELEALLVGTR